MSKNYGFKAVKRENSGTGDARALRRAGQVPAVVYGDNKEPLRIAIPANDLNVEYNKGHMFTSLCDLEIDGKKHMVLARDIQVHPVTDVVIHADFLYVTPKTKIAVSVPVHFINEDKSPGLRASGILNVVRYEVELICTAMAIPEFIEVDLTDKEQGESINISDATLPEGVKPVIDNRDFTLATLLAPKKLEVVEDEEGEASEEGGEAESGEGEGESAQDSEE